MVRALEELQGVRKAYANYPEKRATVIYDRDLVTPEQMRQALLNVGYVATPGGTHNTTHPIRHDKSLERNDHQIDDFICYCFEYTRDDIEQDLIKNGQSLIMEKIAAEKKAGTCDCVNKNPRGR